jgi:RNA polymerase sigma-70 factor (ECF subfamily)
MPDSPSIASSLLNGAQSRDPASWEKLVQLFGPIIIKWTRRAGLAEQDAADVTQDVLRSAYSRIDSFRREKPGDSFRGWLWTITRRKVIDQGRRRAQQAVATGGTTALQVLAELPETCDDEAARLDTLGIVRRALLLLETNFEPRTWQAFWKLVVDGIRADQVAAELGMTTGAVYVAKSRCIARLRTDLADLVDLDSIMEAGR